MTDKDKRIEPEDVLMVLRECNAIMEPVGKLPILVAAQDRIEELQSRLDGLEIIGLAALEFVRDSYPRGFEPLLPP